MIVKVTDVTGLSIFDYKNICYHSKEVCFDRFLGFESLMEMSSMMATVN